jgi:hypothetical protein
MKTVRPYTIFPSWFSLSVLCIQFYVSGLLSFTFFYDKLILRLMILYQLQKLHGTELGEMFLNDESIKIYKGAGVTYFEVQFQNSPGQTKEMNLCCHENLKYPQSICFYFKL